MANPAGIPGPVFDFPARRVRRQARDAGGSDKLPVDDVKEGQGVATMGHVLNTIKPYWHDGAWVFDDPLRGLRAKPFVMRTPEIIDQVLRRAGLKPEQPFTVTFGDDESPG